MDVRLPDGTTIAGVPDGMSQGDLVVKLKANGHDTSWYKAPEATTPAKEPDEASTMSAFQRFVIGAGAGAKGMLDSAASALPRLLSSATEPSNALKSMGYKSPISESLLNQAKGIEERSAADRSMAAPVLDTSAGKAGDIVGAGAMAAPAMLLPGANTYAGASLIGAGTGALMTPGDLSQRAKGAAEGAAGGLVGQGVGNAVARVMSPVGTAATNTLRGSGIQLTPGQALGDTASKIEQKMQSLPLVGDMIANARRKGIEQFNLAATNEALAPIGITVPKNVAPGRDLANWTADTLSAEYGKVVPQLTVKADAGLQTGFQDAARIAQEGGKAQQFADIINGRLAPKLKTGGGTVTGDGLKEAESGIKSEARNYLSSGDPDQRKLGQALMNFRDSLMNTAARYSPPDAIAKLSKIDAAYAGAVRVQGAQGMIGAKEGIFTPAQLLSQVRSQSGGVRKSQFAKGDALLQDFATSGDKVLGSSVPDSGTAGRLLLNVGALGAVGGGASMLDEHPLLASGLLAGAGAYTPAGRRMLSAMVAPRRGVLATGLANASRDNLGPLASGLLIGGATSQ